MNTEAEDKDYWSTFFKIAFTFLEEEVKLSTNKKYNFNEQLREIKKNILLSIVKNHDEQGEIKNEMLIQNLAEKMQSNKERFKEVGLTGDQLSSKISVLKTIWNKYKKLKDRGGVFIKNNLKDLLYDIINLILNSILCAVPGFKSLELLKEFKDMVHIYIKYKRLF